LIEFLEADRSFPEDPNKRVEKGPRKTLIWKMLEPDYKERISMAQVFEEFEAIKEFTPLLN